MSIRVTYQKVSIGIRETLAGIYEVTTEYPHSISQLLLQLILIKQNTIICF